MFKWSQTARHPFRASRHDAPTAAAGHRHVEEDETQSHSEFTMVPNRIKASGRMCHEVGDGHFARNDEGDHACEESEHKQDTADKFNPSGDSSPGAAAAAWAAPWDDRTGVKVKELLRAVLEKEEADDNAQDAEHGWVPSVATSSWLESWPARDID